MPDSLRVATGRSLSLFGPSSTSHQERSPGVRSLSTCHPRGRANPSKRSALGRVKIITKVIIKYTQCVPHTFRRPNMLHLSEHDFWEKSVPEGVRNAANNLPEFSTHYDHVLAECSRHASTFDSVWKRPRELSRERFLSGQSPSYSRYHSSDRPEHRSWQSSTCTTNCSERRLRAKDTRDKKLCPCPGHRMRNFVLVPRQQAECFVHLPRQSILRVDIWSKLQMTICASNFSPLCFAQILRVEVRIQDVLDKGQHQNFRTYIGP